jgi:hypothetical protein
MGCRLHVQKRHIVEHGNTEAFNSAWAQELFYDLLNALDIEYSGEVWDDNFKVSKSDWMKGIYTLRNLDKSSADTQKEVRGCLNDLNYTVEEAVKLFEAYLLEADPNHDFMFFDFF